MRVLVLFNRYVYRGGEDTYVENLIALLKKQGHSVFLYEKDSRDIRNIFDSIQAGLGLFWNVPVEKELTSLIKKYKPHIAHFHNIYPLISATAYRVCKKNNVRIVQTIHNYKFICPKNSLFRKGAICELCVSKTIAWPSILYGCYHDSRLSSLVYSCAFFFHKLIGTFDYIDRYIFPTEFIKNYYCKYLSFISSKKTIVLPHPSPIAPTKKGDVPLKNSPYIFVGRLSEEKGIAPLVSLFKKNGKQLCIVGNGPLKKELQKACKFHNTIRFIPHSSRVQVRRMMKRARAIIIPSLWYEVLPFVLLEGLALSKTIFLSQNKNLSSIQQRNNVIYFKPNDLLDLEKKLNIFEGLLQKPKISPMPNIYSPKYHSTELIKLYETLS